MDSKLLAEKVASSFKANDQERAVSVQSKQFIGIIKQVPSELKSELHSAVNNYTKSKKRGKSRISKLFFPSQADLDNASSNPVKIGYEVHRVELFHFVPKRC